MHDTLTIEQLRAAREALSTYCSSPEFCGEYLRIVEEASRLIARARSFELGDRYRGADRGVLDSIGRIVEFYSRYIAGLYITYGEYVLVEAVEGFSLDGLAYGRGDVFLMEPGRASALYAAGLVRPVESLALSLGGPGT